MGPLEITSTMGEGGMNHGAWWLGTQNCVSNTIQIVNGQLIRKENIFLELRPEYCYLTSRRVGSPCFYPVTPRAVYLWSIT